MEGEAWREKREVILSWAVAVGLGLAMLGWGGLIYFTVGDKGPPPWDYSIIEDIPGEAPYSLYDSRAYQGRVLRPAEIGKVHEQHVMEPPEQSPETAPKGSQ